MLFMYVVHMYACMHVRARAYAYDNPKQKKSRIQSDQLSATKSNTE
jgi:hypothetical protein